MLEAIGIAAPRTDKSRRRAPEPGSDAITITANDPEDREGQLKFIGGSQSDHWNNALANQAVQALWLKNSNAEERDMQLSATVAALMGIAPKDELEGMMAAQLIAAHNAAMECYRRAMIGEQTFEGRRENLTKRTSSRAPMRPCSKPSTAIAARASRRSRSSTSTSMRAGRPWSAWSSAPGGGDRSEIRGTTPCKADCPCT